METDFIVSALSLFAGVSSLPAGFVILRDRKIPVDRQHTVTGGMSVLIAFVLLCLGAMFALNTVAQDMVLLVVLLAILVVVPFGLIELDKRWTRRETKSSQE